MSTVLIKEIEEELIKIIAELPEIENIRYEPIIQLVKKQKRSYVKLCNIFADDIYIDTLCIEEGFRFLSSDKSCNQEELDEFIEDRILQFVKLHKEQQRPYTKKEADRQEKHLRELEENFEEITEELLGSGYNNVKAYRVSDKHVLIIEGSPTELVGQKMQVVKPRLRAICILCGYDTPFLVNGTVIAETSPSMIKRAIRKHVLGENK